MPRLAAFLSIAAVSLFASATWAASPASVQVQDAYAYPNVSGSTVAAAFALLKNTSEMPCELTHASSNIATVEMHDMTESNGIMNMTPRSSIPLAAGARFSFAPGYSHLMLIDLKHDLAPDDHFTVLLDFGTCGTVHQDFVVKPRP